MKLLTNSVLENTLVVIITPNWPFQSRWPSLTKLTLRYAKQGRSTDVLKIRSRIIKAKKHLPLSELLTIKLDAIEKKSYSSVFNGERVQRESHSSDY